MRWLYLAAGLFLFGPSAAAQTDLSTITRGMIEGHILPAYAALVEAADQQVIDTQTLCATPSDATLEAARGTFADVVEAWSAVEFIRFGPARENNAYERLFFWPDRNGRGLNQVQGVITTQDESVTSVESLQAKSVALQGLVSLDYVLFGTGSESLAEGNVHRCAYAASIAGAIANTSGGVFDGWTGDDGYAALMLNPGPENTLYRNEGESLQEVLRSIAEQLQIAHDAKVVRVVGTTPAEARYRRAPFWRSGQSLPSLIANAQAILNLNETGQFAELLPEQAQRFSGTARFELGQVVQRLRDLVETGADLETLVASEETHGRVASVALPLSGAIRIFGEVYPAELGLTLGFNSLDGD